jgi:hypothetical protein
VSTYPPYHPSYRPEAATSPEEEQEDDGDDTSSSLSRESTSSNDYRPFDSDDDGVADLENTDRVRVRRGSEGWEAKPVIRSDPYEESVPPPDRYVRYIPEPPSEEDTSDPGEMEDYVEVGPHGLPMNA